jgi:hypothetical protein
VTFTVIGITTPRVIHNSQMAIVQPIDPRVVKCAWAAVPKRPDVLTASVALKCDLGMIASKKSCLIDEPCDLPVRGLDDALLFGDTLARKSASH